MTDRIEQWSWLDEADDRALAGQRPTVLAVMVTRNAADWLPTTLASVSRLTLRPDRLVVIDNESSDDIEALLTTALERGEIDARYVGDADWGFGQAIDSALARDDTLHDYDYLWLLHDDVICDPDCLERLTDHLMAEPDIDVTGPTLVQGSRRGGARRIAEMGVSIDSTGGRYHYVSPGEVYQNQHASRPVLGISSCGMLIRREVWEELDGMTPALPVFRDGVEFGWRANLAGHRVVTTPEAVMVHRQAGRSGLRPDGPQRPTVLDRRQGMALATAHRSWFGGAALWLRLVVGGIATAIVYLLGKAPGRALDQLRAVAGYIAHPRLIQRLRRGLRKVSSTAETRRATRALRPPRFHALSAGMSRAADEISERWSETFGDPNRPSLDELTGDDFAETGRTQLRRSWQGPTVVILGLLFLLALPAARHLLGIGPLHGARLLPAPTSLADAWSLYLQPIAGAPSEGAAPWLGWFALASVPFLGQGQILVTVALTLAVPLSAGAAYLFLRQLVNDRRIHLVGAVVYGALPAVMGATARGDLGMVAWAWTLPLLGVVLVQWRRRGVGSAGTWRHTFATGVLLSWAFSQLPASWALALVVGIVAIVRGRSWSGALRMVTALAIPLALSFPWLPALWRHPGRLLTGPDPVLATSDVTPAWLVLAARGDGGGLPPLWLSLAIVCAVAVLAIAGVALRPRHAGPWLVGGSVGLAAAVVVNRLIVALPGAQVRPEAGYWWLLGFGLIISAAAIGFDRVAAWLSSRDFGVGQALSLVTVALSIAVALLGIGWWVVGGLGDPLQRGDAGRLPTYVTDQQSGPFATTTLVVDVAAGSYAIVDGAGPTLGGAERGGVLASSPEAATELRETVAPMLAGSAPADLAETLRELGVGTIAVRSMTGDGIAALNQVTGLSPASGEQEFRVWAVDESGPARVIDGLSVKTAPWGERIGAGADDRILVVHQPADPRWWAAVDDQRLEPIEAVGSYGQAFALGDATGDLSAGIDSTRWWAWLQLGLLIIVLVMAAPSLSAETPAGVTGRRGRRQAVAEATSLRAPEPDPVADPVPAPQAGPETEPELTGRRASLDEGEPPATGRRAARAFDVQEDDE